LVFIPFIARDILDNAEYSYFIFYYLIKVFMRIEALRIL
jgi:hypothetical protein